ncbi:11S globulin seed storage protein Ana o 2.0101-like [Euphorbia lathyris]|uniref:11S globulin seed storage protein Ana o 2.0101-like n=1 Tax=Euphorbia lathyris TaxID=212925 RepID=UPI00331366BB
MAYSWISFCCVLLLLHSCSCGAISSKTECQEINRLIAREPDTYISSEAGTVEFWNPFQCAGVQLARYTIQPNGLVLPLYNNSDELSYIVQGKAILGLIIPECSQKLYGETNECQKILRIQRGDVFIFPVGEVAWFYNDGNETYIAIVIARLPSPEPFRKFHIRGSENILGGFSSEFITKAFNINNNLATKIRNNTDLRGRTIYVTGGGLHLSSSPTTQPCKKQDQQERNRTYNVKDEPFCNINTRIAKMFDPLSTDLFIPQVGHLITVDVHQLPILESSQLSASYNLLLKDAMRLPHWENGYSMIYVVKGEGQIQVVDDKGNNVFDDIVKEGQLLPVPKYYVLSEQAKCEMFEYVTFKTTANSITSDLSGQNSVINCLPLEVLINTFRINKEEAKNLKFGRKETSLVKISYDDVCEDEGI